MLTSTRAGAHDPNSAHVELEHLQQRAIDELTKRGGTGRSYNAIPMEVDANRAAARFIRRRYDVDRIRERVSSGDQDAACLRPSKDPGPLDTLVFRMQTFILKVMRNDDFIHQLESAPPDD